MTKKQILVLIKIYILFKFFVSTVILNEYFLNIDKKRDK